MQVSCDLDNVSYKTETLCKQISDHKLLKYSFSPWSIIIINKNLNVILCMLFPFVLLNKISKK